MIQSTSFRSNFIWIDSLLFTLNHVTVKGVLRISLAVVMSPDARGVALVFGEQLRRTVFEPQLELSERALSSDDGVGIKTRKLGPRSTVAPAPSVAKPQRRQ